MLLPIPVGDDNPTYRLPYVNYALIIFNIVIFIILGFRGDYEAILMKWGYIPSQAVLITYFTSLFLHGDFFHLIGNMLYLFIVGDNVEDKLGHVGYLLFYLICGAMADAIHGAIAMTMAIKSAGTSIMANIPCVGASGAISAVLGAYFVMFPRNKIKMFYVFFFRPGTFSLPSFWIIGLWFVMQLFSQAVGGGYSGVAYGAHIGGFLSGFLIVGFLIIIGVLKPFWKREQDGFDIAYQQGMISDEEYRLHNEYVSNSDRETLDNSLKSELRSKWGTRKDDYW